MITVIFCTINGLIKRGYQSKILDHHFERAMSVNKKILLENKEKPSTQGTVPLVLTFKKRSPHIKNRIYQHWYILSINENLPKVFDKRPFISYRRNTTLYQLLGGNPIFQNKVVHKSIKGPKQSGHCLPCLSRMSNLC